MAKTALINYYGRLIKKGNLTIEDVPEELRESVTNAMETIPDPVFNPEIQTPEVKEGYIPGSNKGIPKEELEGNEEDDNK